MVSMVTVRLAEVALGVPPASFAWAVITWLPAASTLVMTLYVPVLLAAALPTLTPSDRMLTVVPEAAVPVNVGVLTLVMLSPLTPESLASVGLDGAGTCTTTPVPVNETIWGVV